MCGISGFVRPPEWSRERLDAVARSMSARLRHRGPDDEGTWVDEAHGVVLAFRRLAIIDLSDAGSQPMVSRSGRHVLVFNGEIYNFPALRRELEQSGVRFRGSSDTEVFLEAMDHWGIPEAVRRANGMFAFAVWDRREHRLVLGRDRFGEKPLYYGWSNSTFLFASELKALRAHPDFVGEVDRDAVALFLRHNYIPCPFSIYRGIHKLPPGSIAVVDPVRPGRPPADHYWSAREVARTSVLGGGGLSDVEAVDAVEDVLRRSIDLRRVADVPLGAFLSGGIDSSAVVALLQEQSAQPVRTFAIGFHEQDYDEAPFARAVARHLQTDHTELYVKPEDALAVIPRLPEISDEPFADSSQIPTFLVAELARRDVTVALSGDGGDELFGGYDRYALLERVRRVHRVVPAGAMGAISRMLSALPPSTWDRLLRPAARVAPPVARRRHLGDAVHKLAHVLQARPQETYRQLVSLWTSPDDVVIGSKEPMTLLATEAAGLHTGTLTEQAMYLDTVTYLPDDILVKVDRAAMAVSLEPRVPLLDPEVFATAWSLRPDQRLRDGKTKWALRQVLFRRVPPSLVERPKKGFGVPIGAWLRGPLREWAEDLLSVERLRSEGFFRPEPVREKWDEHLSGTRDWKYHLWTVLMFQAWLDAAP